LEECCGEHDQKDLEDWVVLDDGVFAEGFAPEEI
jgi:hypothetical protein